MQEKYDRSQNKISYWLVFIGIIVVGINLRAPLTSVGALIPFIREDLLLSYSVAGLITTLPLLAFAFVSPFAPRLSKRLGMEKTIFIALATLLLGLIIRSTLGVAGLFIGTIFIGIAIAIGNVLLPVIIKVNFPFKVGLIMGYYAVAMNTFGALGSGISVPLSTVASFGWQGSLVIWAIIVVIAIILWLPQLKANQEQLAVSKSDKSNKKSIWRSPLAWYITLFMGLQSLMFYTLITWLPDILFIHGYTRNSAGWMLFLMQFALIPVTFIIPIIAEKLKNQKLLGAMTASGFLIAIIGIYLGNAVMIPIAIIIFGMSSGSAFSLSMMLFNLRTKTSQEAAEMSGMAQSFGYFLAAFGPTLFGALHDLTSSWHFPLIMLMVISILIFIFAVLAGKKRYINLAD